MPASVSRSSANASSSGLAAVIGEPAPHLTIFTIVLLLLLYGYEIFNFSLSIDEELIGSGYDSVPWRGAVAQGRWGIGLLMLLLPPLGSIPMLSTVLFCAGLGLCGCVLARVLFRSHSAQWAFAGLFVSSPLWPHVAEFNTVSWSFGIGCVLLTFSLLLVLADRRPYDVMAVFLLAMATGIYQSFFTWFLVLLCMRLLSVLLAVAPVGAGEARKTFPWLRSGLIVGGGLLSYLLIGRLLLTILRIKLTYVQDFVRLSDFTTVPAAAFARSFWRCWFLLNGGDRIFLGYGHLITLLPLLGLLILIVGILWRGPLKPSQRLLAGVTLVTAFLLALSPIVVSAGTVPARGLISWVPLSAFLAGIAFSYKSQFEKPLYGLLTVALLLSIWLSVSLFYTDHLARQRDQLLAGRIMTRVDNVLSNPQGRIPFVVIGAVPTQAAGPFRRLEVFGDSFFDTSHEGGNPYRIAAYLRILGIDTLEPHRLEEVAADRPVIEAMPVWPAAGSVAMVNGMLVIKLGPLP